MTEQLTTFVEMMAHLDLDAYVPLPEPHLQKFHKLKQLRARAEAGDNQALIQELQNQPDVLIRVYAASMIVSDQIKPEQLEILGRSLQVDKNISVRIALAKKLKDVPLDQAISWLLQAIIHDLNAELRIIAAESARDKATGSWEAWQAKVETLLTLIEEADYYREYLDIAALVAAVLPPHSLIQIPDDRLRLADYLIRTAPKYNHDPRVTGIIAALIIQSCDHNLRRVVQRINHFMTKHQDVGDDLVHLQAEINSLLTPAELQTTVSETYQSPLIDLHNDIRGKWKFSIISTQVGLIVRLLIGFIVSGAGLWLLIEGAAKLSQQALWPVSFLQIGLGLILLLIFMIHRGPIRDARQTLVDIGVTNTVYASFTQQSLGISLRYTSLSLQNRLTAAELQTANALLGEAMKNAVQTLRNEGPLTLDDFLAQLRD